MTTPLNFAGSVAVIRLAQDGTPAGLSVIEHRLSFGYATPLHVHVTEDEVFHIHSGELCVEVAGERHRLGAGDVLKAPRGVPHRFIVTSPEGAVALTFIAGADFERFVREASRPLAPGATPESGPPTAEAMEALTRAAARSGLDLIGPPLTLADLQAQAA